MFWDTKRSPHTSQSQLKTAESFSQKLGIPYKYGSVLSTVKNKLLYVTRGFITEVSEMEEEGQRVTELLEIILLTLR
ncbi:hypothetical protein ACB094_03G188000 [Castanea mollissima]